MQYIYKRDGSKEQFQVFKIEDAIKKAFKSVQIRYDKQIYNQVLGDISKYNLQTVEEIQDAIEKRLFEAKYFDVAKSFITYRFLHKMQREHILGLNEDTTYVNSTSSIEEYINKSDWRINANANTGYSKCWACQ